MLGRLVGFSIRFRGVVIALAFLVMGYGLFVAAHAKLDVFPEFAPPEVVVQTEAPGLSPEEVEQLVTRSVESAINGSGNIESIRSQSIQGLSVVIAVFTEGTDPLRARQVVGERLVQAAGRMPEGVHPPAMAPLTSATSTMLVVGLTSEKRTPMELRTLTDWTLRPRLLGVPGVAKVNVFGGEVRQLQVQVRPDRLLAHGLAITDVLQAARGSTGVRGAGFVESENQRVVLHTEGQSLSPEQLGEVVLAHRGGVSVRLKDVARVAEAPEPKVGDAGILGRPGVMVIVSSQYGANTMEVTKATEAAIEEMKPLLNAEEVTVRARLFRPANFIESAVRNVESSLVIGGILVALVLFLFLLDLRAAFISFASIPLSLLAAVIVLDRFGASLNTITLGGFAIAIGVVVDDAIIDVENIARRLRENRALARPRPVFSVVLDASLEVRSAVVYATFIVALVFLPILTMSGVQGKLFSPLAGAFILATLASLAVALTVTPALCFMMLARGRAAAEPAYLRWLKNRHRRLLETLARRAGLVIGAAAALCVGAAAAIPFFGGEFLPAFREGHFILHMTSLPGTSLPESMRMGSRLVRELLKNPHIRSVAQFCGRSEQGDDTWGTNNSEFNVDLDPVTGSDSDEVEAEIRATAAQFPGATFDVLPFLSERIEETISGEIAEVAIKIFGDDLDVLDRKAQEVAAVVSGIPGAVDLQIGSPPGTPQVIARLRPDRLRQFGFRPLDVLEAIQAAYQGSVVAQTYEGNRVFDVAVILEPAARRAPEGIGALMLRNAEGERLPLRALADIRSTNGRHLVSHDGARRRQAVTCNVRGRDVASFVAEARAKIAREVAFPAGVYTVFTGAAEAQERARRQILVHSAVALTGIILLLAVVLGSFRNLVLVHANLPFALVGGVVAVFLTGGWLSVGSLVGFVTLFGISTRNSIMMVSHFEHLVAEEGMTWGLEAALRGASERLVPVLMTALVTALGLLPIAIRSGRAGHEIEGPMAIVILGGLATSTLLNLLVLPTLALRYGQFERPTG